MRKGEEHIMEEREEQKFQPLYMGSLENWLLKSCTGSSLVVQWLRLHTSTAEGTGSMPGRGAKISHAVWCDQKEKKQRKPWEIKK